MSPIDFFGGIIVVTLLAYIPLVCYLDWSCREVKHAWWWTMAVIGLPVLAIEILYGLIEWWMLIPSFVGIIMYFIMMKMHYIEGADFMFIGWICLLFIYNPVTGHYFMALPFAIFLAAMTIISALTVLTVNFTKGRGLSLDFPKGFPMMFPISAALILTVFLA